MVETVFVGRRGGVIVGYWAARPTMMGVPVEKRTQDYDIEFEELPSDHPDVIAFLASRAPFPPVRSMSDREWEALAERSARQEAEGKRLNLAMLGFQVVFTQLETAMSCLLHSLIDGRQSQVAYAIYYSITGFGGRLTAVGNALEQWTKENKGQKDLSIKWSVFEKAARTVATVRNTMAHGAPLVVNGGYVRLTSPPFDVLHVGWPIADGSTPGYSAADLERTVGEISQLRQLTDDFNNYITAYRAGSPASPSIFLALSDRMTPFDKTGPDTQKKPKQKSRHRPSPAKRRMEAMKRHAKRGKNENP